MDKWNFEFEIKEMAESCVGLKPKTARTKASKLFKKYEGLIANSVESLKRREDTMSKYDSLLKVLISGKITYNGGFVLLSEVIGMRSKDDTITLLISNSNPVILPSKHFEYLHLLHDYGFYFILG